MSTVIKKIEVKKKFIMQIYNKYYFNAFLFPVLWLPMFFQC